MSSNDRTLALTMLVFLGSSGMATKVLPGSPLAPPSTPRLRTEAVAVATYVPKVELLLDIRALYELSRSAGSPVRLDVAQPRALRASLEILLDTSELNSQQADDLQQAIRQALGAGARTRVLATRLQMEKRANMALASSRLARDEGIMTVSELRLAFVVPGGQSTMRTVRDNALWNPFRQGVPAVTVAAVLRAVPR